MNNQEHNEAMISEAKREQRRQRRRAALQQSAATRERILASRSGVLLPNSIEVIQELREASVRRTA